MQREIDSVHTRCRSCGQATHLVVRTTYLSDDGESVTVIMVEEVPHSPAECKAFQRLEQETWPTLW